MADDELDVNKTANFNDKVNIKGSMGVSGNSMFNGRIMADDELYVNKAATFNDKVNIKGSMGVSGNSIFNGRIMADELDVNKAATFNNQVNIKGSMGVSGNSMFNGRIMAEDELDVNKAATFNNQVNIKGSMGVSGNSMFNGRIMAEDELNVNKAATFGAAINVNKTATFGDTVNVKGSMNILGSSLLNGTVAANNGLNVYGKHYISGGTFSDAAGQQLVIGNTNESNLRLGRNSNYSWIQSHGSKPLLINPLGNNVCINNVCTSNNGVLLARLTNSKSKIQYNKTFTFDNISNNMDMLVLTGIGSAENCIGSIYFNIALRNSGNEPTSGAIFSVIADDSVTFEYQNNNFLSSLWEYNDQANSSIMINKSGWKEQGATTYNYTIPNISYDTVNSIIRCRITWYQRKGGSAFIITNLKNAISALGKLV